MGGWVVSFSLRGCFLLQLSPSLYFQPTTSCVQSTFSHRANISQHRHRPVYFLAYRTRNLLSYREFTHLLVLQAQMIRWCTKIDKYQECIFQTNLLFTFPDWSLYICQFDSYKRCQHWIHNYKRPRNAETVILTFRFYFWRIPFRLFKHCQQRHTRNHPGNQQTRNPLEET